jgi:DNA primase
MLKANQQYIVPNFKEILTDLGVPIFNRGGEWRAQAIWRGGSNKTSVIIDERSYYDFGTTEKGSMQQLICRITGIDIDEVDQLIELKETTPTISLNSRLNYPKIYNEECLSKLYPDYTYWEGRGISPYVQKVFEVGYAKEHKMAGRMVFPIRKDDGKIIGFAGRVVKDSPNYPKWILIGFKRFFTYSYPNCMEAIEQENRVIIVESIGDLLSLYQAGIKNVMASFGLKVHKSLLKLIMTHNLRVTLSFNNDERKQGNDAAEAAKQSLERFINPDKIQIILPERNDWNTTLLEDGDYAIKEKLII